MAPPRGLPDIFPGRAADTLAKSRVGLRIRSKNPQPDHRLFVQARLMAQGKFPLDGFDGPRLLCAVGIPPNSRTDNVCKSRTSGARFISRCVREGRLQAFVQRADDMKDTSSFLDLALDDSMGFDPLGAFDDDVEEDAEEVTGGYLGTPHTDVPGAVVDTRPAPERIADLFSAMAPRRRTLLGMITFCAAPQTHRRPGCRGGSPADRQLLRVLPRFARELARARPGPSPA